MTKKIVLITGYENKMKRIVLMTLCLGAAVTLYANENMKEFVVPENPFTIMAPSEWDYNQYFGNISISSPDDSIAITGGDKIQIV